LVLKWHRAFRLQRGEIVAMVCKHNQTSLIKRNLLGGTMKILILLFVILPGISQAQIFRCQEKGEAYFSQIPCTAGSEPLVIEDQPLLSENAPETGAKSQEPPAAVERVKTQADNMREFVSTLRRQRTEQLQQIDREISAAAAQLDAAGDTPSDSEQRALLAEKLAELQTSRAAIADQYDSMISEAERRVAVLSTQNDLAENTVN